MKDFDPSDEGYIQLYSRRAIVDWVNITQIAKLKQKIVKIKAIHNNSTAEKASTKEA